MAAYGITDKIRERRHWRRIVERSHLTDTLSSERQGLEVTVQPAKRLASDDRIM
jgi:hypothetical protein